MTDAAPNTSNSEQIEFWNGDAGEIWARQQERMDALLRPITDALLQACDARAGERVIDVGCGCGDTTIALAQRGARPTGVDVSQPMLARARERARRAGLEIEFILGDAATARFAQRHDALVSRFGIMFFADPTAAFENLRRGLREQGRLCFVCWQVPQANPWIAVPLAAARPLLPPQPTADPRAPGPFAFAEADYVESVVTGAGFRDVRIEPFHTELTMGADVAAAVEMVCKVGPLSRALAGLEHAARTNVAATVAETLAAYRTSAGVMLGAACWMVRATA
jgi:SAM-dependent methyltransferase